MSVLFIIIGIVMVLWGADRLTDGATAIAHRLNVPQIVIGLTVVAMGTSAPEFFVSFVSAPMCSIRCLSWVLRLW